MLQESTTVLSSIKTLAGHPYRNTIFGLALCDSKLAGRTESDGKHSVVYAAQQQEPLALEIVLWDKSIYYHWRSEGLHLPELLTRQQKNSSLMLCQAIVSVFTKTRRKSRLSPCPPESLRLVQWHGQIRGMFVNVPRICWWKEGRYSSMTHDGRSFHRCNHTETQVLLGQLNGGCPKHSSIYFICKTSTLLDLTENPRLRTCGSERHRHRESKEKDIRIERG